MSTKAGWYPDPQMTATQRYWDGERWTDNRAPLEGQRASRVRLSTWSLFGIAGAVLLALLVAFMVYTGAQERHRFDCEMDNADRAMAGEPAVPCD